MVGKLMKYEIQSYFRKLFPFQLIIIGIGVLTRIIQFFEADTEVYDIVLSSSVFMYVISCIFLYFMTLWFVVSRFYTNLFKREGYLSFTLPVTTGQHIFAKLTVAVGVFFVTAAATVISMVIAMAGEVLVEVIKAGNYLLNRLIEWTSGNFALYLVEFIVAVLLSLITEILLFYACAALGQLSKKNRGLLAVGIFFGYYIVCQIITTAITTAVSVAALAGSLDPILNFIEKNPYTSVHIMFCLIIIFTVIFGIIYYAITNFVIKKKLNLE